jgi:hypothetical protein
LTSISLFSDFLFLPPPLFPSLSSSGTPEGEEHKAIGPSAQDDGGDLDYASVEAKKKAYLAVQSVRNRRKLKEAADALKVDIMVSLSLPLLSFSFYARNVLTRRTVEPSSTGEEIARS